MLIKKIYYYFKNKFVLFNYGKKAKTFVPKAIINSNDFFLLQEGKIPGPVVLEFKAGYKLKCEPLDLSAVLETCVLNDYEPLPSFQINSGQVVVDVGANIGDFTVRAAKLGARVFAFEPEARNVRRMKENLDINGLASSVKILPYALATVSGTVMFDVSTSSPGGHSISQTAGSVTVPSMSLADFVQKENLDKIDLLKIDIEGGEYEIFSNCPPAVFEKIEKIVGEYHVSPLKAEDFRTLKKALAPHYRKVVRYNPYYFYAYR
jgi:FkbM family methyltransferase